MVSLFSFRNNAQWIRMNSDIESEPPPEPAPPEIFPSSHRDISMASINAITIKQPSNFVLKIDKNGDQIHEEFIPQNQHGKFSSLFVGHYLHKERRFFVMMQQAVTSNNDCHIKMGWIGRSFSFNVSFGLTLQRPFMCWMCRHLLDYIFLPFILELYVFVYYLLPPELLFSSSPLLLLCCKRPDCPLNVFFYITYILYNNSWPLSGKHNFVFTKIFNKNQFSLKNPRRLFFSFLCLKFVLVHFFLIAKKPYSFNI